MQLRSPTALLCRIVVICMIAAGLVPSLAAAGAVDFFDRKPGSIKDDRLVPGREPVTHYGEIADWACPTRGIYALVADQIQMVAEERHKPIPQTDGRLCAIAEAFLGWDKKTEPDSSLWEAVGRHYGLPTAPYHVFVQEVQEDIRGRTASEDPKVIVEKVFESMISPAFRHETSRYGLATMRIRRALTRVAFAYWDNNMQLDPLPRRLASGEKAVVSGSLTGEATNAKVMMSDASGKLLAPDATPGNAFRAEVSCGDKPGTIRAEIRGELHGSPLVARFPIALRHRAAHLLPAGGPGVADQLRSLSPGNPMIAGKSNHGAVVGA